LMALLIQSRARFEPFLGLGQCLFSKKSAEQRKEQHMP
jgi:hypothetical protein